MKRIATILSLSVLFLIGAAACNNGTQEKTAKADTEHKCDHDKEHNCKDQHDGEHKCQGHDGEHKCKEGEHQHDGEHKCKEQDGEHKCEGQGSEHKCQGQCKDKEGEHKCKEHSNGVITPDMEEELKQESGEPASEK